MPNLNNYVQDPASGKIYTEESVAPITAVDPNHWLTDRQNFQKQINDLLTQMSDNIAAEADFFTQFPDQAYQNYVTPEVPTINNPIPTA